MQPFYSTHFLDQVYGTADGGTSYAAGFAVGWQAGPIEQLDDGRYNPNGASVATVLAVAWDRISFLATHDPSEEYEKALTLIQQAVVALQNRENRLNPPAPTASEMVLEAIGNEDA